MVSPSPRNISLLSPVGSLSAATTAASLHSQGSAQVTTSEAFGHSHAHKQQQQQTAAGPAALSLSGTPLAKHNSLAPLRGMSAGGSAELMPSTSSAAGSLAPAGPDPAAQAGLATSMSSSSLAPLSAGSRAGSCSMVLCDTFAAPGAGQPAVMPPADKMGLFRQHSGCMHQSFGHGRGAAAAGGTDSTAFHQLQAVCKARVELYRYVRPWML